MPSRGGPPIMGAPVIRHFFVALIPGVGQVQQDRHLTGLVLFFLFAFSLNGLLVGPKMISGLDVKQIYTICIASAGGVWLISLVDYIRVEVARRGKTPPPTAEGD